MGYLLTLCLNVCGNIAEDYANFHIRWHQQMQYLDEGAPILHNGLIQDQLNDQFTVPRVNRGRPVPPKSPELKKVDFPLWEYVNNEVYTIYLHLQDKSSKIQIAFQKISNPIARNVSRSFENTL